MFSLSGIKKASSNKILQSIIYICFVYLLILYQIPISKLPDCFFHYFIDIDSQEYHLIAVNALKQNGFLKHGYIESLETYNICGYRQHGPVFDLINDNGPFTLLTRPPIYTLYLLFHYYFFGITPIPLYFSSILLISLTSLFILKTILLLTNNRFKILAVVLSIIYIYIRDIEIHAISPELFTQFLVAFNTYCFVYSTKYPSNIRFFQCGVAFMLLMLTKGIFIFVLPILIVLLFFQKQLKRKTLGYLKYFLSGLFILLTPWIVVVNSIRNNSQDELSKAKEKLIDWEPKLEFKTFEEYKNANIDESLHDSILRKNIAYFYQRYQIADYFIIFTNQITDETLLMTHNELCIDGDLHPEWKFINEAYYSKEELSNNQIVNVANFYLQNPKLFPKIMANKLIQGIDFFPSFYVMAIGLFGIVSILTLFQVPSISIYLILTIGILLNGFFYSEYFSIGLITLFFIISVSSLFRKKSHLEIIFISYTLNLLLINIVIYGDERFIEVYNPFFYIFSVYFLFKIIDMSQARKAVNKLTNNLLEY